MFLIHEIVARPRKATRDAPACKPIIDENDSTWNVFPQQAV